MNERIKCIRKYFKKSQEEFADSLELSRNYISLVENGDRTLATRTIRDLCRIYNINENWLLTGEGEMFEPKTREKEIADLAKEMLYADETDFKWQLIELIANMPPDMIEYLKNFTIEYAQKINKHPDN